MKQHITSDQLNELSKKGKEKFIEHYTKVGGVSYTTGRKIEGKRLDKPLLSIGQMIEFLLENRGECRKIPPQKNNCPYSLIEGTHDGLGHDFELRDALWEVCKEVFNEN